MSNAAEDTLYVCLTDVDELEVIAKIGIYPECIPTPAMRPVVEWAVSYFFKSGMRRAPTRDALLDAWGKTIADIGVTLLPEEEEHNNAEWAIEQLKANYIHWTFQEHLKEYGKAMANAAPILRRDVLEDALKSLGEMAMNLRDGTNQKEGYEGFVESYADYQRREEEAEVSRGMTFGLKEIDEFTYGIHPGEIAVVGAPSKAGKSLFTALVTLNEWKRGRKVVLITMENSVEMTYSRLVCIHLGIDPQRWEQGRCDDGEKSRVEQFIKEKLPDMRDSLTVIMPDEHGRTAQDIVRTAKSLGADSLIIDQLTFMEAMNDRLEGHRAIKSILHTLKAEISTGLQKMPILLVHQFSREAMTQLKKNPEIQPWMYADGSEVERTADWAFGLFASDDDQAMGAIAFQTVLARRRKRVSWQLLWRPFHKNVQVLKEVSYS